MLDVTTPEFQAYAESVFGWLSTENVLTPIRFFYSSDPNTEFGYLFHVSLNVGGSPLVSTYASNGFENTDGSMEAYFMKAELQTDIFWDTMISGRKLSMEAAGSGSEYIPVGDFPDLTEAILQENVIHVTVSLWLVQQQLSGKILCFPLFVVRRLHHLLTGLLLFSPLIQESPDRLQVR